VATLGVKLAVFSVASTVPAPIHAPVPVVVAGDTAAVINCAVVWLTQKSWSGELNTTVGLANTLTAAVRSLPLQPLSSVTSTAKAYV